jgi:hypothetical protein
MAKAAEETACIAWMQLWISLLSLSGIVAAIASIFYTAQQFHIGQAQVAVNRAFVGYRGCHWISHPTEDADKHLWRIHVEIQNAGNTPTRNLQVAVNTYLEEAPLPDDFKFPLPDARSQVTINPMGSIINTVADISMDDLQAIKEGKKHFAIWGRATYRDVFDFTPKHETRFCVYATNITGDPLKLWNKDDPLDIRFRFHNRHNCIDDECQ